MRIEIRVLLPLFYCFQSLISIGQSSSIPSIISAQNTLNTLATVGIPNNYTNGATMYGIPLPPAQLIGDRYIDKKWNKTSILLYDKDVLLEGYLTRFDVFNFNLEIKFEKEIKAIGISKIKSMVWIDSLLSTPHYFVNAQDFLLEGVPLMGMMEVLVDGKNSLYKFTSAYIKKADYNIALDVGSRDDKILKKSVNYFGESKNLIKIKGKKDLKKHFTNSHDQLESFMAEKKLSVAKQGDLISIFEFLNR